MSLSPKIHSSPFLPHKPSIETPGSCTSRRSLNIKLPHFRFRSPVSTNSDRQLFNSHFSHLPPGAVVMLPPKLKQQESCVHLFAKNVIDYRVDHSVPGKREPYNTIKKTMDHEEVQRVVETSKRIQTNLLLASKKKGSMYLSELWTKKQALKVIKKSELDQAYKASKEIEREGLPARLKKLEGLYERRKDINGNLEMLDVGKIMEDFENQGINAPSLRILTKKNAPVPGVRTETSILDTEEELNSGTERVKKMVPSLLGIPSSVYDGDTNDTMTVRSKSRSNMSVGSKVRSLSKLVLPKISGTLTDLAESIQDIENNPNGNSNSLGYSRETGGSSYPILTGEEGQELVNVGYTEPSAREKDRGKRNKTLGLRTIIEIAKGGKVNEKNKEAKSTRSLLTERSNKSYDINVLKQKFEQSQVKLREQSQEKAVVNTREKGRSYRNGRKNVWIVPRKIEI